MPDLNLPEVVYRDEWLAARKAFPAREKEHARATDALAAERRRLPMVAIDKEYRFTGPEGEVTLLDLFEGRGQLLVYHAMWLYDKARMCPSCAGFLDQIGHLSHLHVRGTSFAVVTRAPLAELEKWKARLGWDFPLYSSEGSDFNFDFHVTLDPSRGATTYNFRDVREMGGTMASYVGDLPGVSVFLRDGDDVYHTYSAYARGTEHESNVFGFLDFTPLGRQDGRDVQPWARLHDRYDA